VSGGRVLPPYLRIVVGAEEHVDPAPAEPTETEVDRVIRPIVEAGRTIIGAGVTAILDTAAGYGLAWDREELRSSVIEIVGRKLHDDVLALCSRHGIDRDVAARHLVYGHEREAVADAITSSIVQEIAIALPRYGCRGGLSDSRALRAAVREIVGRNLVPVRPHE
jgi:hypothetical protein